jgi:hypothetical protein
VRGSEGHTVIAADLCGQTTLFKKALKYSKSVVFFGGRERLAGQQISAGMIGDGQGVAVAMISQIAGKDPASVAVCGQFT